MKYTIGVQLMAGLVVGGIATVATVESSTNAPAQNKIAYVHKDTGFSFPERLGQYKYLEVTDYKDDGTDISVGYSSEDGLSELTLYVYPAPKGTVGPAVRMDSSGKPIASLHPGGVYLLSEPSETYNEHYAAVIGEVLQSHPRWRIDSRADHGNDFRRQ